MRLAEDLFKGSKGSKGSSRNEIMASCRKHFAEDQEAKELVALVEQHKLEVQQEKDSGKA